MVLPKRCVGGKGEELGRNQVAETHKARPAAPGSRELPSECWTAMCPGGEVTASARLGAYFGAHFGARLGTRLGAHSGKAGAMTV